MSNWQGFKRTKLGQNLQAKIDAGLTKFKITKLGIGDGSYQGTVENMIALSNKKQDLNVSKIEVSENVIKIQTTITNTGVTEKYQMTEIGIFATDPEMGEILYAVMTDPNPDTMPAYGSATVVKKTWTFNLIVDNTGDVSAVIDSASLITVGDLANHNNDTNAHTALAATIDDTIVPKSDTNTIRNLLNNLANRIKTATGASGWKEAPAATLASLSTMFANLATGADVTWDGKKFTNHRLGITGLMDQNGYICFGPNVGGQIIQWVIDTGVKNTGEATHIVFPVAFQNVFSVAISVDTPNCVAQTTNVTTTGLDWRLYSTGYSSTTVRGIAIGK
nr:MAG TPA_asm: tail collar fiber protein [Caudoviricetes sp.]